MLTLIAATLAIHLARLFLQPLFYLFCVTNFDYFTPDTETDECSRLSDGFYGCRLRRNSVHRGRSRLHLTARRQNDCRAPTSAEGHHTRTLERLRERKRLVIPLRNNRVWCIITVVCCLLIYEYRYILKFSIDISRNIQKIWKPHLMLIPLKSHSI